MNVGIVIPDRGDRPLFLQNFKRMMNNQTVFNFDSQHTVYLDYEDEKPKSDEVDITPRYKQGYNYFSQKHGDREYVDVIMFMENDDWYSPEHIAYMIEEWEKHGSPDLFGPNLTFYYHLKLKKYFLMKHDDRSSAMTTIIRPRLKINWPRDNDPYTDQWLWMRDCGIKTKKTFEPSRLTYLGIKHGVGKLGGRNHVDQLNRYTMQDDGFLKSLLDEESYNFYSTYPL